MSRKHLLFSALVALAALLFAAGQYTFAHRSNQIVYRYPPVVRYVDEWARQAMGYLVGNPETGDIIAPVELGVLVQGSDVPPEMVRKCFAFSVGFDPCTGSIQYADALTELGPQPCP